MVMSNLLLQKLSQNSKAKDHLTALERRMQSLLKDLMGLLHEGQTIQKNLTQQLTKGDVGKISKKFAALSRKEKVNLAINLLTENMRII